MKPKIWVINVYWQGMKTHDARDNIEGVFHNTKGVKDWLLHRRQEWAEDNQVPCLHAQTETAPGHWVSTYTKGGICLGEQKKEVVSWGEDYLNIHDTIYKAHEMEVQ